MGAEEGGGASEVEADDVEAELVDSELVEAELDEEDVEGAGGGRYPLPVGKGLCPPQKLCSQEEYCVAAAGSPAASQDTCTHISTNPETLGEHSISGVPDTWNWPKHWLQHSGIVWGTAALPVPTGAVGKASLP